MTSRILVWHSQVDDDITRPSFLALMVDNATLQQLQDHFCAHRYRPILQT